jgi:hypothetical protein
MVKRSSNRTAFPLFTVDISERDSGTGDYIHQEDRQRWDAITKGFPKRAMPIVEYVQPYNLQREGKDPRYGALALLSAFQNADKHRRLSLIVGGLRSPTIWYQITVNRKLRVRLPRIPDDGRLRPGAVVHRAPGPFPPGMYVEAEGTVDVMIGDGRGWQYYSCPAIFEAMVRDVTGVLDKLESYAIHAPPSGHAKSSAYTEAD